jgi:Ca-activated chloride channel family protein
VIETSLAGQGIRHRPGSVAPAAIVIESDGAQDRGTVTPLQGAEAAKTAGIPIYGIALGTRHGFIAEGVGPLSQSIRVLPDPGVMDLLARETGGTSFDATTAGQLDSVYRELAVGIDRRPSHEDATPAFEAAAAILLVVGVGAGILLAPALP